MTRRTSTNSSQSLAATETHQPTEQQTTTIIGRLCADPVLRHTKSGKAVTTIRVAVNDGSEAQFHSVVVWGRTAETVCRYLKKGRRVQVDGRSRERSWQTADGTQRQSVEISAFRVQFLANWTPKAPVREAVS